MIHTALKTTIIAATLILAACGGGGGNGGTKDHLRREARRDPDGYAKKWGFDKYVPDDGRKWFLPTTFILGGAFGAYRLARKR